MVSPLRFRLLAAVILVTVAPARAQELRYTRPLEVTDPGWIRVALSPEVLRRTAGGGGVRLFGPEGDELPFVRLPREAPSRRPVEPLPPEPTEDGWGVPLLVAAGSRPHQLLVLSLEGPDPAEPPDLRLEGRADDGSWQLLAAGTPAAEDRRLILPYPATDLRRLRLVWPRRPGDDEPPRLAGAAVEEVPPGASSLSVSHLGCRAEEPDRSPPRAVCRLQVGGSGRYLRRVCFTVAAEGAGAYRLFRAVEGRWDTVAEAAWEAPPAEAPRCALVDLTLAGVVEPLRLELYGGADGAPGVRDVAAGFAPEVLQLRAGRPGVHTLAYGPGVFPSTREADLAPPAGVEAAVLVPGPEEVSEVPASALAYPTAAGPAPPVDFQESWQVTADTPEPGRLHRLTLPAAVYSLAQDDLDDLRLLVPEGGSRLQVPYVLWRPDEPELAAERQGDRPAGGGPGDGPSRLRIELPEPGLPLSALVVSVAPTAAGDWTRGVRLREVTTGVGGEGTAGAWMDWSCRARPPLPCRVTVPLEAAGAGALVVEVDDRGQPPLPALDLELWRRRDVLLFPWPAEDATPVLAVGAEELEAPEFELSGRREELVARPWREARLVTGGEAGGRLGAVAITVALLAAAVALVVLLDRILVERGPGRQ